MLAKPFVIVMSPPTEASYEAFPLGPTGGRISGSLAEKRFNCFLALGANITISFGKGEIWRFTICQHDQVRPFLKGTFRSHQILKLPNSLERK